MSAGECWLLTHPESGSLVVHPVNLQQFGPHVYMCRMHQRHVKSLFNFQKILSPSRRYLPAVFQALTQSASHSQLPPVPRPQLPHSLLLNQLLYQRLLSFCLHSALLTWSIFCSFRQPETHSREPTSGVTLRCQLVCLKETIPPCILQTKVLWRRYTLRNSNGGPLRRGAAFHGLTWCSSISVALMRNHLRLPGDLLENKYIYSMR